MFKVKCYKISANYVSWLKFPARIIHIQTRHTRKAGMDPWDGMDSDSGLALFIGVMTLIKVLFRWLTSRDVPGFRQYSHHTSVWLTRDMTKPRKSLCAQRRLRSVWVSTQSDQSLRYVLNAKDPSFLHADSQDSDQTGRMPRLIWVFAERTVTLLILSCRGSCLLLGAFGFYHMNSLLIHHLYLTCSCSPYFGSPILLVT